MTTTPVVSITDELLRELESACNEHPQGFMIETGEALALTTELRRLRAEVVALRTVCKDVSWRVSDTCDQLQATGFDGDRRYGLDEWSAPIKNLNMAVGILERAMQSNTEGN